MTSIQERLQLKREPLDKWSTREQLCLASAVARSGDQNWMSVSRALKPFGEPNRPPDWFHQKNCAAQYGMLLAMVETPKRKKRATESGIETPAENILKKLQGERLAELKKLLAEEKAEYQKLHEDMILLQSGQVSEEQLDIWCKEIDKEEYEKEQEAIAHAQWLKEREQRKQEIERVWRPNTKLPMTVGQKRKNSDSLENLLDTDQFEEIQQQHLQHQQLQNQQMQMQANQLTQEMPKPSVSPLLTSLLKSPSQVHNNSILHTAITNRLVPSTNTNPMIASLLSSTTAVPVSPGIQQLVTSAIGQNQETSNVIEEQNIPIGNDILDDTHLTNIKLDDLANSILVQDGPLPEIKKEEVDDIISEIIENAGDIVDDPEQHLQLDGNGDININLELSDFDDEEIIQDTEALQKIDNKDEIIEPPRVAEEDKNNIVEQTIQQESQPQTSFQPVVDPFEFQEDPVDFEPPTKPSGSSVKQDPNYVPHYQQQQLLQQNSQTLPMSSEQEVIEMEGIDVQIPEMKEEQNVIEEIVEESPQNNEDVKDTKEMPSADPSKIEKTRGSVEIVEVGLTEDEESEKELNKSQIEDIVHTSKQTLSDQDNQVSEPSIGTIEIEVEEDVVEPKPEPPEDETAEEVKTELVEEEVTTTTTWTSTAESKESESATTEETSEPPNEANVIEKEETVNDNMNEDNSEPTTTSDSLCTDLNEDVATDKMNSIKRDYSRTKKKEEFDMLLTLEKQQIEESELIEEGIPDINTNTEKKDVKPKIKLESERSNSPWTEEEDNANRSNKRRYSTATPVDSVPNSPASSSLFYEDDREYKNWKKSVMLVYNRLATNRYASLFLKPITEDQAPGYSCIVYRPMDLQTIKKNIENGTIRTTLEFKRDVMLMFTNAIMYNKTNDFVYNMALQMQQESLQPIEILLQAQQGEPSFRRETRTSESGMKRKRTLTDELLKVKKKKDE